MKDSIRLQATLQTLAGQCSQLWSLLRAQSASTLIMALVVLSLIVVALGFTLGWTPTERHRLLKTNESTGSYWETAMQILIRRQDHGRYRAEPVVHQLRIGDQGVALLNSRVRIGQYVAYSGDVEFFLPGQHVPIGTWMENLGVQIYWIEGIRDDRYEPGMIAVNERSRHRFMILMAADQSFGDLPPAGPFRKVYGNEL